MSIAQNIKATQAKEGRYYATGRRKDACARVFLHSKGTGKFTVNGKTVEEYLGRPVSVMVAKQALVAAEMEKKVDINVTTQGGGHSGQSGAIRLGVAKALIEYNPELRPALKKLGYLTRDSRTVESKKYGKRKARRSPQFSKR